MKNVFGRYTLVQVPSWVIAGAVLAAVHHWFGLPTWVAGLLLAAYIAKDFLLYPALKHAYEAHWDPGPVELIGETGTAAEAIAPAGYVRVRGELWSAELARGAEAVPAGARIRVQSVRGTTLIVMESK